MLHIRPCLIHKGGMRGKHLGKGLFQVHFFLGGWFAHSGWWHVVLIGPPSITLIILIITPPLALILVLIVVVTPQTPGVIYVYLLLNFEYYVPFFFHFVNSNCEHCS